MGLILTPNEIGDLSRSVRPAAEEGTPAWGTAADVLGRGFKRFAVEPDTVALWDFTRRLGDPLADLSPEGNDLTLSGDVVRAADGPFGFSYEFDGTGDYLSVASAGALLITGELTVESIVKADSNANLHIASRYDYGANDRCWLLAYGYDGSTLFRISVDGGNVVNVSVDDAVVPVGTPFYVAGVFKPSTYTRLIVNGCMVAENTTSIPASIFGDAPATVIGAILNNGSPEYAFNGHIYTVRITPRAKSLEELWRAGGRLF